MADTQKRYSRQFAIFRIVRLPLPISFVSMRWPNGPVCPRCGSTEVTYQQKYRRFQCKHSHDGRQFTVKTGSVMEDSPLGLDKMGTGPCGWRSTARILSR